MTIGLTAMMFNNRWRERRISDIENPLVQTSTAPIPKTTEPTDRAELECWASLRDGPTYRTAKG
jgi:hypothetical protein